MNLTFIVLFLLGGFFSMSFFNSLAEESDREKRKVIRINRLIAVGIWILLLVLANTIL
jgi:hypothetical protein